MTNIGKWYIGENKMIELIIYNIVFWFVYGYICSLPAKWVQYTIDNYDKAIEINPNEGYFYTDKGDALYDLGKEDEACANYINSSELGYEEIQDYLNSSDGDWCKK